MEIICCEAATYTSCPTIGRRLWWYFVKIFTGPRLAILHILHVASKLLPVGLLGCNVGLSHLNLRALRCPDELNELWRRLVKGLSGGCVEVELALSILAHQPVANLKLDV